MLFYIKAGGPILYILLILSVISLGVILERSLCFFKNKTSINPLLKKEIKEFLNTKKYNEAIELSKKEKGLVGKILTKFLIRYCLTEDYKNSDELLREIELEEMDILEKNTYLLGIIAYTAPMIGLLGTVTGMIQAFGKIAESGTGDPNAIAGGISQALLTTAGGLIIAIPSIIAYNIFNKKIEKISLEVEKTATFIVNIVKR
ncbi:MULTISPECIES: MotA/TolQ/ExbB proton channel family protein [Cetobacterium]|jgi:biopolymer transport protein ExbB|uniref:MotA/TolQ/ExbB proton channel family protein n=1 Tax=Candidatus Cetobacterium colombiensis TaxID=3073100 RepID=A0ABU4WEE5_9FUSO|nr:MotA/TolQ/ExbB proton channel family protein [Candidatus Cetobacterium colombiensis]MDX8336775.1 MotA/TolQ/ExbB proton channel family protein [Candidatus Cetobacterium colombiensis]